MPEDNPYQPSVSIALVHWPIVDKQGKQVVTNVTHLDVHDLSRSARTYGVKKYFIVNRLREQLMFVTRMIDHWTVGKGRDLNDNRRVALEIVAVEETVDEILRKWPGERPPLVVATAARNMEIIPAISFKELKTQIWDEKQSQEVLLLFGTGHGLHDDILSKCDVLLEPIKGAMLDDFRHLSVRSAVSICLDRLLSQW